MSPLRGWMLGAAVSLATAPGLGAQASDTVGTTVVHDPLRWLEATESAAAVSWARHLDSVARATIEGRSEYPEIFDRISSLAHTDDYSVPLFAGDDGFLLHVDGTDARRSVRRVDADGAVGPHLLPTPEQGLVVTGFAPSSDGGLLARELGSEGADARQLVEVWGITGEPELLARFGGTITQRPWLPGDSGLVYTDPDDAGGRVGRWHRSGAQPGRPVVRLPVPGADGISAAVDAPTEMLVVTGRSDGRDRVWVGPIRGGSLVEVDAPEGGSIRFMGSRGGTLYFFHSGGNGGVRALATDRVDGPSREIPLETDGLTLREAHLFGARIVALMQDGPRPLSRTYDPDGRLLAEIDLPLGLVWTDYLRDWSGFAGDAGRRMAYLRSINLTAPGIYRLDTATGTVEPFLLRAVQARAEDFEVEVSAYWSHDGESIPILVARRKDGADGPRPALIYAYGAYGFTPVPFFNAKYLTFMERGGVFVIPYLRGGGVKGDRWHRDGSGARKANTVHDLIHAARWLVERDLSAPGLIGVEGQSPGGTVAAAAALLAPDLWGAVALETPVADLVRHQLAAGRVDPEFGDVSDPSVLSAMLDTYSPYHLVESGRAYPPVLVRTSDVDRFVDPYHSYKLVRRLRDAGHERTFLRVAWSEGHGFLGTIDRRVAEWAADLTFLTGFLRGAR